MTINKISIIFNKFQEYMTHLTLLLSTQNPCDKDPYSPGQVCLHYSLPSHIPTHFFSLLRILAPLLPAPLATCASPTPCLPTYRRSRQQHSTTPWMATPAANTRGCWNKMQMALLVSCWIIIGVLSRSSETAGRWPETIRSCFITQKTWHA